MQITFADPATVALDPAPIEAAWIIEGTPQARARELVRSADGTTVVVAWSCTAGRFNWHYRVDEMVHVISGEAFVTDENGAERRLGPGDMAFFPVGSRSLWHVPVAVRKLAVCRHALPMPLGFALRAWRRLIARANGEAQRDAVLPRKAKRGADLRQRIAGMISRSPDERSDIRDRRPA
jgi:uncharacterized cupin superfamily protein